MGRYGAHRSPGAGTPEWHIDDRLHTGPRAESLQEWHVDLSRRFPELRPIATYRLKSFVAEA